jgi:hypothetical protein
VFLLQRTHGSHKRQHEPEHTTNLLLSPAMASSVEHPLPKQFVFTMVAADTGGD